MIEQFYGRVLHYPETLRVFENEDDVTAADEYARKFIAMEDGSVAFVEITRDESGPWHLWRVECVGFECYLGNKLSVFLTARSTESEALAEIRRYTD